MSSAAERQGNPPGHSVRLSLRFQGLGMVEFLVALLVFSSAMMGLMSAQLAGSRASVESTQRAAAIALVRDMIERIRSNSGQLNAYSLTYTGGAAGRLAQPENDCDSGDCSPSQLAAFDLWQWQQRLLDGAEQAPEHPGGLLLSPRACIFQANGVARVVVSWLSTSPVPNTGLPFCTGSSGEEGAAPSLRQQFTLSTFVEVD